MNLDQITQVRGLPARETEMLRRLIKTWSGKLQRNKLRYNYYSYKNRLRDFGISIPDKLKDVETVVGWPAKAVDALAVRSLFLYE